MSANVYENAPRYTARQVADDVAAGMDPDVELVAAQYYDALCADLARVKAESLRVVPWGCPVPISELHSRQAFQCDHPGVWRIYGCSHFNFDIRNISSYAETMLTEAAIVQPVRIERWEDE